MAGLYIEDKLDSSYKSQLRIGGYNADLMGQDGETNIVWWPLIDSTSWHLNLLDAKFGSNSFMPTNSQKLVAELNPGEPYIALPFSIYKSLASLFVSGLDADQYTCDPAQSATFCIRKGSCSDITEIDISFKLQGSDPTSYGLFYDVPPENYLQEVKAAGLDTYC